MADFPASSGPPWPPSPPHTCDGGPWLHSSGLRCTAEASGQPAQTASTWLHAPHGLGCLVKACLPPSPVAHRGGKSPLWQVGQTPYLLVKAISRPPCVCNRRVFFPRATSVLPHSGQTGRSSGAA